MTGQQEPPTIGGMTLPTPALEMRDVFVNRGSSEILHGLSMAAYPGRITVLLGPNGSGKSTTLSTMVGLLLPSKGQVNVFGRPFTRAALRRIGATIDGPALYPGLTATENVLIHTKLLGLPKTEVQRVLQVAGLTNTDRKKVKKFSTGMRARLAYAIALVGNPELLILDEPQNGLDPEGMIKMRDQLRSLADSGRAVVVSSHQLGEVVRMADDLVVISGGIRKYQGPLANFSVSGDLESAYLEATR